jgi:hypothetical protein
MYKIKSYKSVAQSINNRIYTDYFYRLMLISKSLFEWHNLPNGIDERWIERYLFTEGECIFYKDPNLGLMVTKMGDTGPLNYYDEPTNVMPYAFNYTYNGPQLINNENCVIIRNNDDGVPTLPTIQIYAQKLTNIDRTIDVNIENQKTPVVILCSDKQKLSMKQVINQRNQNEIAIYGDKNLDLSQIKTLDLRSPIVFDKLQIQKHSVWNECMTFLGINNANQDKRERLVTDEVSANDEQVRASEDTMLKTREHACKLINKMFGTNIYVTRRRLENPIIEESEGNKIVVEDGEE